MQTCSICNTSSNDQAATCPQCNSKLSVSSTTAVALKKFINNPRVTSIRVAVANDACPVCFESRGTFAKNDAPILPHRGCSHQHGCRCSYEPVLSEIYP